MELNNFDSYHFFIAKAANWRHFARNVFCNFLKNKYLWRNSNFSNITDSKSITEFELLPGFFCTDFDNWSRSKYEKTVNQQSKFFCWRPSCVLCISSSRKWAISAFLMMSSTNVVGVLIKLGTRELNILLTKHNSICLIIFFSVHPQSGIRQKLNCKAFIFKYLQTKLQNSNFFSRSFLEGKLKGLNVISHHRSNQSRNSFNELESTVSHPWI